MYRLSHDKSVARALGRITLLAPMFATIHRMYNSGSILRVAMPKQAVPATAFADNLYHVTFMLIYIMLHYVSNLYYVS